jgi:L-asparaginase II
MSEVLLHYTRGEYIEDIHRGDVVAVDVTGKIVDAIGDAQRAMYWRSAAKPFQALQFVKQGGLEKYGITQKELALLVSSHSGEPMHVELVKGILAKIGLTADALDCGPARPMNYKAANALVENHEKPQAVHNPCSGKHSQILALCRMMGLDIAGYTKPEHEVEKIIHAHVAMAARIPNEKLKIGIDGCGVPVFYLPLYNMALAYARLAMPEKGGWGDYEKAALTIRNAMRAYPEILAGTGRIDTVVSTITKGRIIAKIGANAVYCLADTKNGIGIAFKIEDGSYRAINPAVIGVLKRLDLITGEEYAALLEKFPPVLKNHRGDIIGTVETMF